MSRARHPAQGAVGDALATTAGQGVCFAAGLLFSVFVPRVLGAANYGEWMLFRGLAIFWLSLLSMGDREVISNYYVPRRERGEDDDAARVFKSLVLVRLVLLPAGLAGAGLMLASSTSAYRTVDAALCLLATVAVKSLQSNLSTLIFGRRRLGWVAFLDGTQAVLVPLFVLAAFGAGRAEWIPRAALAADVLLFALAFGLSRVWREWRPGWLRWRPLLEIVRYAAVVSLAASVIVSLNNLLLYLMNLRGYAAVALGRVGLATRCAWIVFSGLVAVSTALMPALAAVQVHHGAERMFRWQDFLSRLGLALLLWTAGNVGLLGPCFVQRIWGDDFAALTPLLVGGLVAVAPLWLGAQWIRQFLLQGRTRVYLEAAVLYAATLGGLFFLLPRDGGGWMPILALIGAGGALAVHTAAHAARNGAALGWVPRFLPAAAWLGAAWWAGGAESLDAATAGRAVVWNLGFLAALGLPGALRAAEIRELWSAVWTRPSR